MAEEQAQSQKAFDSSNPREHLCLCPSEPKIPRPRNSFMLFRQHQQSSIMAQNPGLSIPDVSKIIGEQWRSLSVEAKEGWNSLAEEEKTRHQQQYPGYRYQPRRNGRASVQSSASGPASTEQQELCIKCGGRPMNGYTNASPIYTPPATAAHQPVTMQVPAKRSYVVSSGPPQRYNGQPPTSPELMPHQKTFIDAYPYQRVDSRLVYAVTPNQPLPTPASADSQDAKRRRFNSNGAYVPAREPYPEGTYTYAHSPIRTASYARPEVVRVHPAQVSVQHGPMARPAVVSPPRAVYPRPPQLQPVRPPQPHQRARSTVALPPIETLVSQTPTKSSSIQSQSSGVEAMIMSIPVLNKIKVLNQISAPLPTPGPMSPRPEVRGAIIAIEGMDSDTVNSMTASLAEQLEKEGKFAVRIFGGPDPFTIIRDARNRADAQGKPMTTEAYLSMLSDWHKINKEMVEYISTRPGTDGNQSSPMSLDASVYDRNPLMTGHHASKTPDKTVRFFDSGADMAHDAAISPKTMSKTADLSIVSPPCKTRSQSTPGPGMDKPSQYSVQQQTLTFPRPLNSTRIPPPPPTPPPATPPPPPPPPPVAHPSSRIPPPHTTQIAPGPPLFGHVAQDRQSLIGPSNTAIPIALVPHFQLTTVNAASISMPISDGFSPPAHWQWFATLWRGCIGPDITVVVKGVDDESEAAEAARASVSAAASTPMGGRERNSSAGLSSTGGHSGVEIRLSDCRAVVVKTAIIGMPATSTAVAAAADGHGEGSTAQKLVDPVHQAKEMENWEKAKRRVGFEVEEFLRR
ncbi:slightly ste11-like protein [Exophiala sideris]|uniref:Slightly ste11-like protein n=1 Tax=Exophiala sideris TaxID=1016849 RepID=A0ABR0JAS9_9EURO|nr:slightly ste11-like protein [Exophiala sideris]KAK5038529.1 slightly ste11-like protein [Exophiala sideris]KAK5060410.1 slightly ste11-like protein [Exophiala sideris]KAK5183322.1 slightly ste11-like protein [Eurotiomycetes sp. CCFEE 6388]